MVPLCGKAVDLTFLAEQGHEVVGAELSQLAVEAFFQEHSLQPEITAMGAIRAYRSGPITVLQGDFFEVTTAQTGHLEAWYDRAALIALPPDLRKRYISHLKSLLPDQARGLLVNLVVPADDGPPFSVDEQEIRAHFPESAVDLLDQVETEANRPNSAPVKALTQCFRITLAKS